MNKTPVKETTRQAGPHMRPPFDPVSADRPLPGCQNLLATSSSFTASGTYTNEISSSSIQVSLIVSDASHNTRMVPGNLSVPGDGTWSCSFDGQYPRQDDVFQDNGKPAVLIVRAQTTQGGTVILYVPFCHDPGA